MTVRIPEKQRVNKSEMTVMFLINYFRDQWSWNGDFLAELPPEVDGDFLTPGDDFF